MLLIRRRLQSVYFTKLAKRQIQKTEHTNHSRFHLLGAKEISHRRNLRVQSVERFWLRSRVGRKRSVRPVLRCFGRMFRSEDDPNSDFR